MTQTEHKCALRALSLCDGDLVVDLDRALAQGEGRRHCYCSMLATSPRVEVGQELRTARARTVARADEVQRRIDAHSSRVQRAGGPDF